MDQRQYLILDYETFSECDLKKAGAWEYSMHPSTEILCVGFKTGTKETLREAPVQLYVPSGDAGTEGAFSNFYQALRNPDVHLVAHNAFFEQVITRNVFGKKLMYSRPELQTIPIERWTCTAATARSFGLPGKLEQVGLALKLTNQKDMEGHRAMLKLSKTRKFSKKNPLDFHDTETAETDYESLYLYCMMDIDTETELFLKLPSMTEREREFWILDQKINMRGFHVDRELVTKALPQIAKESKRLDGRVKEMTAGHLNSTRQVAKLKAYLKKLGCDMENLQGDTIRDRLKLGGLDPQAAELLDIRQSSGRSSTSKYTAFEMRSRTDGRARDNLMFYGAHTGRQSGTGLQPQNLFTRTFSQDEVEWAIELVKAGDTEAIEAFFGRPMDVYASLLRSCIVAAPGKVLNVGDFSKVEVCVLFWLAGHTKGIHALNNGIDLYIQMASVIYNLPVDVITKRYKAGEVVALLMRQLGKQTVLGAGFGIGVGGEKFLATAQSYGMDIDLRLAQKSVRAYRDLHRPIPIFWSNLEAAAVRAMREPGKRFKIGKLVWQRKGSFLTCQLPIGRKLYYYKPQLRMVPTMYGDKPTLTYWGVDSVTKKFVRQKTWGGKLTENVVQAVARDLLWEATEEVENYTGSDVIVTVHDELIGESDPGEKHLQDFLTGMGKAPVWAEGLPIQVEGWQAERYRK